MRSLIALFVVCCTWFQPSHADDKGDKELREKLEQEEKEIANSEAKGGFEKTDWAVKNKERIAELTKFLDKAERIDLFRLDSAAATILCRKYQNHGEDGQTHECGQRQQEKEDGVDITRARRGAYRPKWKVIEHKLVVARRSSAPGHQSLGRRRRVHTEHHHQKRAQDQDGRARRQL